MKLIGAHNMVRPKTESYPHYWTNEADCLALLRMMEKGKIKAEPVISHIVSPDECGKVYDRLTNDRSFPLGVLFDWKHFQP